MIITIDGPTASGKSTTAQLLAQKLGFYYLNSGLLYRAFAYILLHNGYTVDTIAHVKSSDIVAYLGQSRLTYDADEANNPIVKFDGTDITYALKGSALIDQSASIVSANNDVRQMLLKIQRDFGQVHSLVIDGRDAGTVVFPNAEYKFYLTADIRVRAGRLMIDQQARGNNLTLQEACSQIEMRDKRDIERTSAPLKVPVGAIIVDNSLWSLEETVRHMLDLITKQSCSSANG